MWINVRKRVAAESWISCFAYRWCPGRRLSLLLSLPWPWSFTSPLWFLVFLELMYYVDVALRSFWGITKSDRLKIMLIAAGPKGKQTIFIHLFYSLIRILVSRTNFTNNVRFRQSTVCPWSEPGGSAPQRSIQIWWVMSCTSDEMSW